MLPVLQAEGALLAADVVSYPHLRRDDMRQTRDRWRRAASRAREAVRELQDAADVRAWFAQAGYTI